MNITERQKIRRTLLNSSYFMHEDGDFFISKTSRYLGAEYTLSKWDGIRYSLIICTNSLDEIFSLL